MQTFVARDRRGICMGRARGISCWVEKGTRGRSYDNETLVPIGPTTVDMFQWPSR